jgi:O-antigen/teichoic acid export membrane protein
VQGIFRNIGWLLGSRGLNALLSLIYLALATRSLGVAGFGQFALIVVMAQAIAGIASFNTWQAVVRWGAGSDPQAAPRAAGFALALDLVSLAAGLPLAALACWLAPLWLPLAPELRWPAFALCAATLIALRSTPTGLLRLHDRYDLATLAEATLPTTRAAGAVAAFFLSPGVAGFLAAWAVAEVACSLAYWGLARRLVRIGRADLSLADLPAAEDGVWRFVLATNLSRTLAVTAKQAVLLAVGALGGAAMAGGFRVAAQLGQALVQLGEAVSRAVYPDFVRRSASAAGIAVRMAVLAAGTGLVATLLALLFGKPAITAVAGAQFAFVHAAMAVLVIAGAIDLAGASWDALLVARGRAGLSFMLRALPLALALAALPLAIAGWGLTGVALAMLGASGLTLAGVAYVVLRERPAGAGAGTIR